MFPCSGRVLDSGFHFADSDGEKVGILDYEVENRSDARNAKTRPIDEDFRPAAEKGRPGKLEFVMGLGVGEG